MTISTKDNLHKLENPDAVLWAVQMAANRSTGSSRGGILNFFGIGQSDKPIAAVEKALAPLMKEHLISSTNRKVSPRYMLTDKGVAKIFILLREPVLKDTPDLESLKKFGTQHTKNKRQFLGLTSGEREKYRNFWEKQKTNIIAPWLDRDSALDENIRLLTKLIENRYDSPAVKAHMKRLLSEAEPKHTPLPPPTIDERVSYLENLLHRQPRRPSKDGWSSDDKTNPRGPRGR